MSDQESSPLQNALDRQWGYGPLIFAALGAGIGILMAIVTVPSDDDGGLVLISKNTFVFAFAVLGLLGGVVVFALMFGLIQLWRFVAGRSARTPAP